VSTTTVPYTPLSFTGPSYQTHTTRYLRNDPGNPLTSFQQKNIVKLCQQNNSNPFHATATATATAMRKFENNVNRIVPGGQEPL